MTTYSFDDADETAEDILDPDLVLTNGSDSSGEGKLVANSVDGEDGLVDIRMKDSNNGHHVDGEVAATADSGNNSL